jgi:hypothetical protein
MGKTDCTDEKLHLVVGKCEMYNTEWLGIKANIF